MKDKFKQDIIDSFKKLSRSDRMVIKKLPFFQRLSGIEYSDMEEAIKELKDLGIIEVDEHTNPQLELLVLTEQGKILL